MSKDEKIVFCTGGGCTAKLGAGVLSRILEKLPRGEKDPNLLVGYDSRDDAAVYRVTEDLALVQTVDFFPPMVDDPYTFGQIAAANALSDVYAMGGEVKTALNLVPAPASSPARTPVFQAPCHAAPSWSSASIPASGVPARR